MHPTLSDLNRIMFMREFPIITSSDTVTKLKRQVRPDDIEKYGDAFIPANVYDAINKLPRFSAMKVSLAVFCPVFLMPRATTWPIMAGYVDAFPLELPFYCYTESWISANTSTARTTAGCRGIPRFHARGVA